MKGNFNEARCVIVLWSKTSIESSWVQEEADDAKRRGILVPVLIENVRPPIGFRGIQAADLVNWDPTEPTQAFRRLIADMAALIGPPHKEAEEEGRRAKAEVERQAEEERKRAESEAKLEAETRRKAAEEAVARRKAEEEEEEEEENRERPSAQPSPQAPGPRSATPGLREQLEYPSWSRGNWRPCSAGLEERVGEDDEFSQDGG